MSDDGFSKVIQKHVESKKRDIFTLMAKFTESGRKELSKDSQSLIEIVGFSHLLKASSDMHRMEIERFSEETSAEMKLQLETIKIAGIGMRRLDVPDPRTASFDNIGEKQTFIWKAYPPKDHTIFGLEINPNAADKDKYKQKKWQDIRFNCIKKCIEKGADIICLGEYDYPIPFNKKLRDDYEKRIKKLVDGIERPIFLVAGSSHDFSKFKGKENHPRKLSNVARIFPNDYLANRVGRRSEDRPTLHCKRTPAVKVGERLTPEKSIKLKYYETQLGRIAVLICSDAYDPNIIFGLLQKSSPADEERIDFILVPAYNASPKLVYACQTLSLLSKTVLLLVDACDANNEHSNSTGVSMFINGVNFDQLCESGTCEAGTREDIDCEHSVMWNISSDFLIEEKQRSSNLTPFVDHVKFMMDVLPDYN